MELMRTSKPAHNHLSKDSNLGPRTVVHGNAATFLPRDLEQVIRPLYDLASSAVQWKLKVSHGTGDLGKDQMGCHAQARTPVPTPGRCSVTPQPSAGVSRSTGPETAAD